MAKLSLNAEFALHEFSVRYRAALAKQPAVADHVMGQVKDAVREQYEQERQSRGPAIESPAIEAPKIEAPSVEEAKIEAPKIEPPKIEGPEPEI